MVRLGAENPSLLTCSDVDVLWRVAAAFAQTDRPGRATDAYRYILTNCNDANERLATVQMALPLLPKSDLQQLLALERTGQNGVGEFQPVRVDIARQAVADGGSNRCAWVYTACPSSRAKPISVRWARSASEIASAVGAEIAAISAMPTLAAFIAIS